MEHPTFITNNLRKMFRLFVIIIFRERQYVNAGVTGLTLYSVQALSECSLQDFSLHGLYNKPYTKLRKCKLLKQNMAYF